MIFEDKIVKEGSFILFYLFEKSYEKLYVDLQKKLTEQNEDIEKDGVCFELKFKSLAKIAY